MAVQGDVIWRFGADCLWWPGLYPVLALFPPVKRRIDTQGILQLKLTYPAPLGRIGVYREDDTVRSEPICVLIDNLACHQKRWALPSGAVLAASQGHKLVLLRLDAPEPMEEPVTA